jgi:tRNA nucleotidyltransferase/poly(A) polymerase
MKIPPEVAQVADTLEKAGFEAYLVGGCVRDMMLDLVPKDWDITTNANPDQIQGLFPHCFYENKFGTVGVVNDNATDETLKTIEVTPYRLEGTYTDNRHPDTVTFSKNLEDDLKRRDFTINAIALSTKGHIVDPYKGQEDLKNKALKTVGNASERFIEDALRILRAIRISAQLGFTISHETTEGILLHVKLLENISKERIRDEFIKMLMTNEPMLALVMCQKLGVLKYIAPELLDSIGVDQNKSAHKYTVWEHLLRSMQHAADKKWPLETRITALFHDISKPETKRFMGNNSEASFYGHEVIGSRVTKKILERLKFPVKLIEKVTKLVRWHMFFADTEQITLSAVRRMIVNVGKDNVWDLMNVRACDRIGTGRPKESPYRLRKYHAMVDEAMREPVSLGMLKIDGKGIMEVTHETPGPKIGYVLYALFNEVIEDISRNTKEYLEARAIELSKIHIKDLKTLGETGKSTLEGEDDKKIAEIRGKHGVK